MRDIKFRVYSKTYGMSEPCSIFDIQIMDAEGLTDMSNVGIVEYTGLKDSTKWEQLSDQEKGKFYNSVCSEDGKTIKYQTAEDVKYLWQGKEIYEGDILDESYINPMSNQKVLKLYEVVFTNGKFDAKLIGHSPFGDKPLYFLQKAKIIGNIWESPELLGGQNAK